MKINLNLNSNLKDLDGNEIENANIGEILAKQLVSTTDGDALKHFDWALVLKKGETIDLDTSDQEYLKRFVKESKGMTILTKAQILKLFIK